MDAVSPSNLMISPTSLSQPILTSSYILEPDMFSATTTKHRYKYVVSLSARVGSECTYGGQRPCRCVHTWTRRFRSCLPCCFLSCVLLGVWVLLEAKNNLEKCPADLTNDAECCAGAINHDFTRIWSFIYNQSPLSLNPRTHLIRLTNQICVPSTS